MGAVELDPLSWPEVKAGIEAGRDLVVMALGAFEQHGPVEHGPLRTLGRDLYELSRKRNT